MKVFARILVLVVILLPVLAKAQSGIGLPPFDANTAFHIKKSSFPHALRVDGLVDDPTDMLTDVVVKDANGVLYYRPISDLTVAGEWTDDGNFIYATRARNEGTSRWIAITDDGNMGFGTTTPRAGLDLFDRGMIIGNAGVSGLYDPREEIRLTGGTSDVIMSVQDGTGRFNIKWNASFGNSEQFLSNGDYASKMLVHGDPALGGDVFRIDHSTTSGTAGAPISWTTAFNIENNGDVGIGTAGPTTQLDVNGQARVRNLPNRIFTGVPAADDFLVTAQADGTMGRVRPSDLFEEEGEWQYQVAGAGDYIYAVRAEDETGNDVVIDEFGRIGVGRTQPEDKIHITNGGMRIDGAFGIGFAGELPYAADPLVDGSRIYSDPQGFGGGNRDALVIEKTDDPGQGASGGILFANRSIGNTRTISMSIGTTGNVGIGLSSPFIPQEKFHLLGDALVQRGGIGTSSVGGVVRTGDGGSVATGTDNGFQASDASDYAYFGLRQNGAHRDGIVLWGSSVTSAGNASNKEDFKFIHTRNGVETEAMRIDGFTRNVGIGVVPATDMKLDVNGRARVRSLPLGSVGPTGSTDFVVTANANGELFQIDPNDLVNTVQDLDWTILGDRIYNANSGTVGVGLTNPDIGIGLHINGTTRLEGSSRLEFESSNNYLYRNGNDTDIRSVSHGLFTFRGRGDAGDILTINGANQTVGIGTNAANAAYKMDIAGDTRLREGSQFVFGDDADNHIRSNTQNELTIHANEQMVVRNRFGQDVITALRNRRVGIQTTVPTAALDVNGNMRIRTIPAGASSDDYLSVDASGNVRKLPLATLEGPWEESTFAGGSVIQRNVNDRVGIGTTQPAGTLHVFEPNGTVHDRTQGTITLEHGNSGGESSIVFKSRSNANSDYGYISFSDDGSGNGTNTENGLLTIGVENDDNGGAQDDIAIMPSGYVGINTNAPSRMLDLNGDLRVRSLKTNTSDIYALTADADGNVNQQEITSIRDNLGDHDMDVPLATNGFIIKYDDDHTTTADDNDGGLELTPRNSLMISNRLQIGSLNQAWVDDPITGITSEGFAGNDGAFFAPVYTGSENSDLRLYLMDNDNDAFSIWGDPCGGGNCGSLSASRRVARFEAGGDVWFDRLAGGGDRMVVAKADGRLDTAPIPTSGGGSTADNFGNHIATQNIRLNNRYLTNNGSNRGLRINDSGNLFLNNTVVLAWSNNNLWDVFNTRIVGNTDADGAGGDNDLLLIGRDDIVLRTRGSGGGDVQLEADNDVDIDADDDVVIRTNASNERLRVLRDGTVRVNDLSGTGNRIVTAAADGTLQVITGSSTGLWDRDGGNNETYLSNLADEVGIGTADPDAALHIQQALGSALTDPLELRLQNRTGNGGSEIFFQEGSSTAAGFRFSYDGVANKFFIRQGDGTIYSTIERGKGDFGIGTDNPETQLHVVRNNANGGSGSGLDNPARMRIQNETTQGSAGVELMEGAGGISDNNGMSMRYHSAANGSSDAFELVRGAVGNTNAAHVHLSIDRNSGQTTIQNLGTGGIDEMVIADVNGVLSTRAIDANIWNYDSGTNRTTLANTTSSVGIGEATPGAILDINGDLRIQTVNPGTAIDAILVLDGNGTVRQRPASAFTNFFIRNGAGEIELANASNRVGLGTAPAAGTRLHVGSGAIRMDDLSGVGTRLVTADPNGTLATEALDDYRNHWDRNAATSEVSLANGADEVGIGTTTPAAKLHVVGDVRISDLATGAGVEMVIADNNGTLSTQAIAPEQWTQSVVGGIGQSILTNSSDNVGIGVAVPTAKLDVQGDVRVGTMITGTSIDELVVVGADGILKKVPTGTYSDFWSRDVVNQETYLTNINDKVGVGINDPLTELHIQKNDASDPAELRVQNRAANGSAQIRLVERLNNVDNNSVLLRYNGATNHFEITNGFVDAAPTFATYFTINRNNGLTTIGNAAQPGNTNLSVIGNSIFDGNINMEDAHRIQFAEPNSYLRDQSNTGGGDDDVMLRAADILYLRGGDGEGIRINGNGTIRFDDVPNGATTSDLLVATAAGDVRRVAPTTYASNFGWRRAGTNVTLFSNGDNVGIGTTSAGSRLDVNGTTRIRGAMTIDNLGGGGAQMVVADNAGVLSVQAIPTFTDTDDQGLLFSGNTITIEDGTGSIDLSPYLDNTDAQDLALSGTTLSLTNDGTTVDLSGFANTDAQAIGVASDVLSISGNASTVDLSPYLDNTDAQAIVKVGNTLNITGNASTVDLSSYLDNTDAQAISLSGTTLSITGNAGTVDLSSIGALSGWSKSGTDITLATATDNVGIGVSPAASVRFHVGSGNVRFDVLSGGANEMVVADANGQLSKMAIPTFTNHLARTGTQTELANSGDNFMIGVGTATAKLQVAGDANIEGLLTVKSTGTNDPLRLENLQAYAGTSPYDILVVDADGDVQVQTSATASDRRLKENIKRMEGTLDKLLGMESVSFNYRQDVKDYPNNLDTETHYGVIAQQVQEAFPHAVVEKDGYLHIKEKELMGVVISATKELSAKNAELEAANEHLAEQVYHMMMDKADLEKTVHGLRAETSELQTSMAKVLEHLEQGKQVQASGN